MNKIVKIYALIATIIAIVFYLLYVYNTNKIDGLEEKITELSTSLNSYKTKLEKEHDDKVELDRRNKELEKKAKIATNFNWYTDIFYDPVVVELREQSKKHRNRK